MHYVVIANGPPQGWTPPAGDAEAGKIYWVELPSAPPDGWAPAMVEAFVQVHAGIRAAEGILPLENGHFRAVRLSIPDAEDAVAIAQAAADGTLGGGTRPRQEKKRQPDRKHAGKKPGDSSTPS